MLDLEKIKEAFDVNSVGRWCLINLIRYVLASEEKTYSFCFEIGLLKKVKVCSQCKHEMHLYVETQDNGKDCVYHACYKRDCAYFQRKLPVVRGTFLEDDFLSLHQILIIMYCFVMRNGDINAIVLEASTEETAVTSEMAEDWMARCREICVEKISQGVGTNTGKIGGLDLTVEVDEGKFSNNMKANGEQREDMWVVGGVCKETREIFLTPYPKKKRKITTLTSVVQSHVHNMSTVILDCWKDFESEGELPEIKKKWAKQTASMDYKLVDPAGGGRTPHYRSKWWTMKRKLVTSENRFEEQLAHFCTHLWQVKYREEEEDLYLVFLRHLAEVYKI